MTFTEAYLHYHPYVYKVCKQILKNNHEAEDATQDTFDKLIDKLDVLADHDNLHKWLYTTAHNICVDILRKHRHETLVESVPLPEATADTAGAELLEEAGELARNFAPKYREAFHLAFECGYSNHEIAKLLHIPLSTVKTRLRVCTQKLRDKLL